LARTIEHRWAHSHQSARLLPQFPWDDDPGPTTPMYFPGSSCITDRFRTPAEYITPSGGEEDANLIDSGGLAPVI
jgi:hypothetical protein